MTSSPSTPAAPCATPSLSWANTGGPLLLGYCAPCHASGLPEEARRGAPLGVNLDTAAAARPFAERIVERAVTSMDMPPSAALPDDEQLRLVDWIACGMP